MERDLKLRSNAHELMCVRHRTTPNTVFYQCYAHRKLGWIMQACSDLMTTFLDAFLNILSSSNLLHCCCFRFTLISA